MQRFNYHTHTARCGHAVGTDEEYVEAAIKAGYAVLGFSDHAPYKEVSLPWARMDWRAVGGYLEAMKELKERYDGIIELHTGFETEYYPEYLDERKELRERTEYLILGQHFADPDGSGSYFGTNTDSEILGYAESVCKGLDTGLFLYLCHPDVFMSRQSEFSPACEEAARMICAEAARTGTPMEINVHRVQKGKKEYRNGPRYYYPHREFWEIAAEYPVKCLIGVDAHDPAELLALRDVEDALEELKDLKLDYVTGPLL